jgi:hypothetical protein
MPTTTTLIVPASRNGPVTSRDGDWFRDQDGAFATTKRSDETVQVTLDWTDRLASGETLSTATYQDSGVTRSGVSVSSPNTIATVLGLGEFEVTVTTSASRVLQQVVRFYDSRGGAGGPRDYQ